MSGARFPSIPGAADRCNSGLVGAPDTVRCPLPTVGAGHVSPVDCAADRCAGGRWLTGQSGAPPDSLVIFSRTPPSRPESSQLTRRQPGAPDTVRCTTGHCLVHHRTLSGAPRLSRVLAARAKSFPIVFSPILALRQNMLVHKNQCTKSSVGDLSLNAMN